jgi:membrane-associated protein
MTVSVLGSIAWGVGLPIVWYLLGNVPFVSRHIELIVVVMAVASVVPVIASAAAAFVRRRQAVEGR